MSNDNKILSVENTVFAGAVILGWELLKFGYRKVFKSEQPAAPAQPEQQAAAGGKK